jgi:hypothetical protein
MKRYISVAVAVVALVGIGAVLAVAAAVGES